MVLDIKKIDQIVNYSPQKAAQVFLTTCAIVRKTTGVAGQPNFDDCQRRACADACPFAKEFPNGYTVEYMR